MVDYSNVISVGCAVITLIFIGFIARKFRIIKSYAFDRINTFIFKPCFVPLIANNVVYQDLSKIDFRPFGACALAIISTHVFLLFVLIFKNENRLAYYLSTTLPSTYVNYVIIGIPIFDSIWDASENQILTVITLCNDLIAAPIYLILSGINTYLSNNREHVKKGEPKEKFSFKIILNIIIGIIKNPIIIGYIIGFFWAGVGIPTCYFIDRLIIIMSQCVLALSCFCVGSFLADHSLLSCSWVQFIICAVSRHIIMPLLTGLFSSALGLSGRQSRQAIVITTLPTAVASYLLSYNANIGTGASSTMIFWTNIFFIPIIIAWFAVLDALGIFIE
ncbi:Auxin Efflux Carrier family protein [Histomonas meleagridis]|uniref:Auxin Efflux Carrier family protein n=1 Tax=Histomonas meleagridis TaxID=135588 RepID=UPI00355985A4|nr:Auxin Efflux Carrier family protein [Histomonas meleagridis]KAH0796337.1 Auxin Efflux Carrier family protein [Histomonas meleagridis]